MPTADPTPLTDVEVEEMERLCGEATEGPWDVTEGRTLLHVETPVDHPVEAGMPVCSIPKKREADATFIATARTFIPRAIARIREQDERIAGLVQTSAELCEGCGWRFRVPDHGCMKCDGYDKVFPSLELLKADERDRVELTLALEAAQEQLRTLESRLRRYEPRVGDRVTWENVRELREGRRVTWTTPDGKVATATKQDDDVWCIDGTTCCITDSAIVGEHGGPPTFILSLPPEAPNADRS
jgi:hypothetical protein